MFDDSGIDTDGSESCFEAHADGFDVPEWGFDTALISQDAVNDHVFGAPEADAEYWHQQTTNFTCAVVSQQMILEQFGIEVSEAGLVYQATTNGWLTDGGTSPDDVAQLLEMYGIGTHTEIGASVDDLINELSHGRKVIVGIDSGEIWGEDSVFEDLLSGAHADHAVVLTGLDVSDPSNPLVMVNDPGHPRGEAMAIPLEKFADSWEDSGNMYVATDDAPPDLALDPRLGSGFDGDQGVYINESFWDEWKESFREHAGSVMNRTMESGNLAEATVASLVQATLDAWESMDESSRDDLLVSI
jgi:hypothetical protein